MKRLDNSNTRSTSRWAAVALFVASSLCATVAWAQGVPVGAATEEQRATASESYGKAKEAFTGGRFEEALTGFRASHAIVASPNARYMIVAALSELGRDVEAYEQAIAGMKEAEAAIPTDDKYKTTLADLTAARDKLRGKIGMVTVTMSGGTQPGAALTIDGRDIPEDRWSQPIPVTAGPHTVSLSGYDTKNVDVSAGGDATVDFAPPEEPIVDVSTDDDNFFIENRRIFAYVLGGVGVVGLGLFGAFGGLALSKEGSLDDACNLDKRCPTESQADIDDGKTFQTAANVMLVVGAVTLAAGVGLFVWDLVDSPSEGGGEDDGDDIADLRLEVGPGQAVLKGSF